LDHTLFILDEPTTGLHQEDVRHLLSLLQRLVDQRNTVLVIEHQIELIATCDYVVDMGPEGGAAGGRVLAQGTPQEIAETPESWTGRYLKSFL
jgi:excinuclease ABC subunit A